MFVIGDQITGGVRLVVLFRTRVLAEEGQEICKLGMDAVTASLGNGTVAEAWLELALSPYELMAVTT